MVNTPSAAPGWVDRQVSEISIIVHKPFSEHDANEFCHSLVCFFVLHFYGGGVNDGWRVIVGVLVVGMAVGQRVLVGVRVMGVAVGHRVLVGEGVGAGTRVRVAVGGSGVGEGPKVGVSVRVGV